MLMDQLLKKVKAALADRAEWQIYDAYDPTPFDKRPDWFLTVGISGTEMQSPFLSGEFLYYPFTASVQVILLAPPDTDVRTLYDSYCREVFSGMLSAGFALQHIRIGSPEELRQFRRIAVKGGGTSGMSGLFRAVTPRSFPVKLGDLTFHATGWKLSCVRQYAQQNGVQGSCYVTNSGARTKQLVLDGSFFCLERPYEVILPLDAALREKTRFSFTLRDMRFSMAEIVGYSIAEKAMDGVLPCQMTLIVPSVLTYVPPETGEVTEST